MVSDTDALMKRCRIGDGRWPDAANNLLAECYGQLDRQQQHIRELDERLQRIAVLAHAGGLAELDHYETLSIIRRLSLSFFDMTGEEDEMTRRVLAAVDALPEPPR